ncbi:hypothetical protein DO71_2829 [Burkholderia pseudomallei]|nr:hypothetical protein DO73_902 [Burkholderia pseudomallei]KGC74447.1 hypothetical protein DO71_2829 [Burkholderia pseudomallei]KGD10010.1 hypothetical protein DP42_454 [Burkholderia pseudomallei]
MIGSRPSRQCGMRMPRAPRAAARRLRFPYRDSIGLDEESCRATPPRLARGTAGDVRDGADRSTRMPCGCSASSRSVREPRAEADLPSWALNRRLAFATIAFPAGNAACSHSFAGRRACAQAWRPVRARVRRSGCAAHALPSATIMECMRAGAVRSVEPTGRLDSFNSTHSTHSSAGGARRIAKRTARGQVSNSEEACRSPARC